MKKIVVYFLSLSLWFVADFAKAEDSANKIILKLDRKMTPTSAVGYRKLINIEPDKNKKEFIFYWFRREHTKTAILFLSPASDKGRTTLRLGDNMWLYVPSVGKPVRIASLQSVVGGVFNNADIMALDFSEEYDSSFIEKKTNEYIIKMKAKKRTVAYDTCKIWVDRKLLLPKKLECYTESGILVKTLYFKSVKNFGKGIVRPSVIETDSPMYAGYKSIMLIKTIRHITVPDEYFTLNYMSKLEDVERK
ncbi:MAG: outer membrane lipoprotein-sorting protein [Spirochaetota bacterium]|nr:outer membrane lipoprotein-sorting protein [Spirochaetota bacterium]